jgi:hypothetical protein
MLMTETKQKTKVQEIAEALEMDFKHFAARCMLRDLSYQTAKDVWYGVKGDRGYNAGTKLIVAKVLRRPVAEIFPDD